MKLIMNADDLGLTEKVNNAIVDCFAAGVVKSTTLMINQQATDHAVSLIKQGLIPEVGLHITISSGKPVLPAEQVSDLVDQQGCFLSTQILREKKSLSTEQIYQELQAQYNKAVNSGIKINHLDSHHFAATFPALKETYIRFANDLGLPSRRVDTVSAGQTGLNVQTPQAFDMGFYDDGVDFKKLQELLLEYKRKIGSGTLELMCHPARAQDKQLAAVSSYCDKRAEEFEILTSPELIQWLSDNDIECVGFESYAQK
ncbi:carbohydrate deacetylase [Psychromonas ossibalaenae]|uniref:carbohydrate deacetylase n=1 Tax=Psychromonas ossibalaenae TaxID=444922 RepID=UPI0004764966|nr:carbohydrate deacetylase [Psychromonas ossibalaenae]